jgi:hypothetical protein
MKYTSQLMEKRFEAQKSLATGRHWNGLYFAIAAAQRGGEFPSSGPRDMIKQ